MLKQNKKMFIFKREEIDNSWHYDLRYLNLQASDISDLPLHCHDYFELEIILGGQCTHVYNDQEILLSRGSAYLLTFSDLHAYRIHEETDSLHMVNINFDMFALPQEIIEILVTHAGDLITHFDESEISVLTEEVEALNKELTQKTDDPLHELILKTGFLKIVLTFLRKCHIFEKHMFYDSQNAIFKAITFTQLYFRDNITLSDVAKHINFSPNYFGNLFKKHTGTHFNEYLKQLRLEFASNLLKNSDYSIYLISQYAGFYSSSYFIQAFKEQYQMTPRSYRLKWQTKPD